MDPAYRHGFSLIELVVTIALFGLLASIAYPSYRDSILRTHRTEARAELSRSAQGLEKCFTQYAMYNNAACAVAAPYLSGGKVTIADGRFEISGVIDVSAFAITATAKGVQAADSKCGTITLTDTNARTPAACW